MYVNKLTQPEKCKILMEEHKDEKATFFSYTHTLLLRRRRSIVYWKNQIKIENKSSDQRSIGKKNGRRFDFPIDIHICHELSWLNILPEADK